jgi:aryl-alcohol dehydrogenase-like predicted oxidoreductase
MEFLVRYALSAGTNRTSPSRGISMPLPASSRFQLTDDLNICRILNGMWQVSGAHGAIDPVRAVDAMFVCHDARFTTWDLADHYGPAEDFIGTFRRQFVARHGVDRLPEIQAFTKWVPHPGRMTRRTVEDAIDISLARMGVERLDLLQFHWWDYKNAGYLDALKHLADLQQADKIRHLALTNFDTEHLRVIADHGVCIVSNQVQYSLIDRRPEVRMAGFCRDRPVTLLAYGTLLGGLLSETYLGRPEPLQSELNTASLRKYKHMVDVWGGWPLFQELLTALQQIANKHRVSIANIGINYILDRPAVAGVIVGARLGVAQHVTDNARVFSVKLDADDLAMIEAVLAQSRDLFTLIGDCGDEYR